MNLTVKCLGGQADNRQEEEGIEVIAETLMVASSMALHHSRIHIEDRSYSLRRRQLNLMMTVKHHQDQKVDQVLIHREDKYLRNNKTDNQARLGPKDLGDTKKHRICTQHLKLREGASNQISRVQRTLPNR